MKPYVPETLPITTINWEPLIPLIGQANRALAHYGGILHGLRNPEILLSPLTTQEAVLSSRIEGTRATLGEVLKHEAGEESTDESKRVDILEIINYRRALSAAQEELKTRPFTLNLLLKLHEILLDSVRGKNKARGHFRTSQNFIGAPNSTIEQAKYVPPAPPITPYLHNWEKYYHLDRPDPLVQLAIVHAQFEIIHPFLDGNGRLGRMLIPLFLYEKKLLSKPMFYISAYLEERRDEYVECLRNLSGPEKDWNLWIGFFLKALIKQAESNSEKAQKIIQLYDKLKEKMIELTHSQYAVPLLDRIVETPIFKSSSVVDGRGLPSKPMVMTLLAKLKKAGVLKMVREGSGRRAQVLVLAELVNLCEGRKVL